MDTESIKNILNDLNLLKSIIEKYEKGFTDREDAEKAKRLLEKLIFYFGWMNG